MEQNKNGEYMERINILARDLDDFAYEHDPYEYMDTVDNRVDNLREIEESLTNKDGSLQVWLQEIIEEGEPAEDVEKAKGLLERVGNFYQHAVISNESRKQGDYLEFYVAECEEFHNLGEYYEGIRSVEEAITLYQQIPPERMNAIPCLGICVYTSGEITADLPILTKNVINMELLDYVPGIKNNKEAMKAISKLIEKIPEVKIDNPSSGQKNKSEKPIAEKNENKGIRHVK